MICYSSMSTLVLVVHELRILVQSKFNLDITLSNLSCVVKVGCHQLPDFFFQRCPFFESAVRYGSYQLKMKYLLASSSISFPLQLLKAPFPHPLPPSPSTSFTLHFLHLPPRSPSISFTFHLIHLPPH